MRSKRAIITIGWYKMTTFDLIRSGLSRTTFPSRGRLFSPRRFLRMKFRRAGHAAAPTHKFDRAYRPSSVCPGGRLRRFLPFKCWKLAGEACLAPTVPRRGIYRNSAAYTPAVPFGDSPPPTQGSLCFARGTFSACLSAQRDRPQKAGGQRYALLCSRQGGRKNLYSAGPLRAAESG